MRHEPFGRPVKLKVGQVWQTKKGKRIILEINLTDEGKYITYSQGIVFSCKNDTFLGWIKKENAQKVID